MYVIKTANALYFVLCAQLVCGTLSLKMCGAKIGFKRVAVPFAILQMQIFVIQTMFKLLIK